MATVFLSPVGNGEQFFTTAGVVLSGGLINTYAAGTTTPTATWTDSTGTVSNANPIVLNSAGRLNNVMIYFTQGQKYKFIITDSASNTQYTLDNLSGINDTSTTSQTEWNSPSLAATYTSGGNTFTLSGNQTSTFQVGRRVQLLDNGSYLYGNVTSSTFTSSTSVVVLLDSGTLDSGLTTATYAFLGEQNPSVPSVITYPLTLSSASNAFTGTLTGNASTATSATTAAGLSGASPVLGTNWEIDANGQLINNGGTMQWALASATNFSGSNLSFALNNYVPGSAVWSISSGKLVAAVTGWFEAECVIQYTTGAGWSGSQTFAFTVTGATLYGATTTLPIPLSTNGAITIKALINLTNTTNTTVVTLGSTSNFSISNSYIIMRRVA